MTCPGNRETAAAREAQLEAILALRDRLEADGGAATSDIIDAALNGALVCTSCHGSGDAWAGEGLPLTDCSACDATGLRFPLAASLPVLPETREGERLSVQMALEHVQNGHEGRHAAYCYRCQYFALLDASNAEEGAETTWAQRDRDANRPPAVSVVEPQPEEPT